MIPTGYFVFEPDLQ